MTKKNEDNEEQLPRAPVEKMLREGTPQGFKFSSDAKDILVKSVTDFTIVRYTNIIRVNI